MNLDRLRGVEHSISLGLLTFSCLCCAASPPVPTISAPGRQAESAVKTPATAPRTETLPAALSSAQNPSPATRRTSKAFSAARSSEGDRAMQLCGISQFACSSAARSYIKVKRYADAIPALSRACELEEKGTCVTLGRFLARGLGTKIDRARARSVFRSACQSNDGATCFELGLTYAEGWFEKENDAKAARLYLKACELDYRHACADAGNRLVKGWGVRKDRKRGLDLVKRSCDSGNMHACRQLATYHENGIGVRANQAFAKRLYQKSCDGENPHACVRLAEKQHEEGNLERAEAYYRAAFRLFEKNAVRVESVGRARDSPSLSTGASSALRSRAMLRRYERAHAISISVRVTSAGAFDPCARGCVGPGAKLLSVVVTQKAVYGLSPQRTRKIFKRRRRFSDLDPQPQGRLCPRNSPTAASRRRGTMVHGDPTAPVY